MEVSNLEDCSICSLCGNESDDLYINLGSVKTAHSETPINRILKRLFTKASMEKEYEETAKNLSICESCLNQIDECDLAHTKAMQIENALISILKTSKDSKIPKKSIDSKISNKSTDPLLQNSDTDLLVPKLENFENAEDDVEMASTQTKSNIELYFASKLEQDIKTEISDDEDVNDCDNYDSEFSSGKEEPILCQVCKEVFDTSAAYKVHLASHEANKMYSCEICKESYNTYCSYDVHQNIHLGKSELECRYCEKVWKKRSLAVIHNRVHTKPFDYQCERCGKQFVHKSSLRAHLLVHDDVRKVTCHVCQRMFRNKPHLNAHMRTHTGERPYGCDFCGRKFAKQCNLKEHRKLHVKTTDFKCNHCSFVSKKQADLVNHMKEMHPDFYKCRTRFSISKTRVPVYDENFSAVSTIVDTNS